MTIEYIYICIINPSVHARGERERERYIDAFKYAQKSSLISHGKSCGEASTGQPAGKHHAHNTTCATGWMTHLSQVILQAVQAMWLDVGETIPKCSQILPGNPSHLCANYLKTLRTDKKPSRCRPCLLTSLCTVNPRGVVVACARLRLLCVCLSLTCVRRWAWSVCVAELGLCEPLSLLCMRWSWSWICVRGWVLPCAPLSSICVRSLVLYPVVSYHLPKIINHWSSSTLIINNYYHWY